MTHSIFVDSSGHRYVICPRCGLKSYNQSDLIFGYCGLCHKFFEEEEEEKEKKKENDPFKS